jgi:ribosomal protein S18 acetylase RimI-like enzyme
VNLYYLAPAWRGRGLGQELEAYAMEFFRKRGLAVARLSVAPRNATAVAFYLRHGWRDLGPRPEAPEVHLMEKRTTP